MVPMLQQFERVQAMSTTPETAMAKLQAADLIPLLRKVIFPEDGDG